MDDSKLEYAIDKYINDLLILPKDLNISTIVATCKANFNFNTFNIGYYFDDYDDILIEKQYKNISYTKTSSFEIKKKKIKIIIIINHLKIKLH